MEKPMGAIASIPAVSDAADAVRQLRTKGRALVLNVLAPDYVSELRVAHDRLFGDKRRRHGLVPIEQISTTGNAATIGINFVPSGGNHDRNRWNMLLPSSAPFLDRRLLGNPIVVAILDASFVNPVIFLLGSDVPMPNSGLQSVHQDMNRFGLTVQFAIVDISRDNGPTEIWPGSHLPPAGGWHSKDDLREIVRSIPSEVACMPAGSLFIRNQRLVHRGTVNNSPHPRPLLSIWVKEAADVVPHRWAARAATALARAMQKHARGRGPLVKNSALLDLGNSLRMRIYELAETDRLADRQIPPLLWEMLDPASRRLLRRAAGPAESPLRRAVPGDIRLMKLLIDSVRRFVVADKTHRIFDSLV
jgi:hypothetical protein